MPKHDGPTSTERAGVEALIARLEAGTPGDSDTRLLSRLLRLLAKLINLVEQKNSSISRLKRLLFGPGSDTRSRAASTPEAKQQDPSAGPVTPSASTVKSADSTVPPQRKGHGRLAAADYTGASVVECNGGGTITGARGPSHASLPQKVRDQVEQLSYRLTLKLRFKVEFTGYHNETKDEGP